MKKKTAKKKAKKTAKKKAKKTAKSKTKSKPSKRKPKGPVGLHEKKLQIMREAQRRRGIKYEIVNFEGSKYQEHLRKKGYYGKEKSQENSQEQTKIETTKA